MELKNGHINKITPRNYLIALVYLNIFATTEPNLFGQVAI